MPTKTQKNNNLTAQQIAQYRNLLPHVSAQDYPSIETIGRVISDLQTAANNLEEWLRPRIGIVQVCEYLYKNPATRQHLRKSIISILRKLAAGKINRAYASAKVSAFLRDDLATLVDVQLLRRGKQGYGGLFLTVSGAQVFNGWPNLKDPPARVLAKAKLKSLCR
jgi:hypothetical protein